MPIEQQLKIQELNARYADAIDDDRLESWPDFFTEQCRYLVTTAENVAQGLPIGLMYATSRAMLRDRIKALREANVYEAQRYRHILGPTLLAHANDVEATAKTSFIVARVMDTGETTLFATGCYHDRVVFGGKQGAPHFAEKIAVLDSRQIDTLLAIPL
jgi:3-phenylpropionate/cinnamic acid dioxygenase small subunit